MTTNVERWGNSQGLRLSRQILEAARISVGDEVDVVVQDGTIMIAPVRRVRGKDRPRQLVARMPEDYKAEEVEWGRPVGKEAQAEPGAIPQAGHERLVTPR